MTKETQTLVTTPTPTQKPRQSAHAGTAQAHATTPTPTCEPANAAHSDAQARQHVNADKITLCSNLSLKEQLMVQSRTAVFCFTAGACPNNGKGGPGGVGVVISRPCKPGPAQYYRYSSDNKAFNGQVPCSFFQQSHFLPAPCTNNVADLKAVHIALLLVLEHVKQGHIHHEQAVVVYTYSKYVYGVLSKSTKARANAELVRNILASISELEPLVERVNISCVHGQTDVEGHSRAVSLAKQVVLKRNSEAAHEVFDLKCTPKNRYATKPCEAEPQSPNSADMGSSQPSPPVPSPQRAVESGCAPMEDDKPVNTHSESKEQQPMVDDEAELNTPAPGVASRTRSRTRLRGKSDSPPRRSRRKKIPRRV